MSILAQLRNHKVTFNPYDQQHVDRAVSMLKTNGWGASCCPFKVTMPYLSIVDEIKDKLLKRAIDNNAFVS